MLKQMALIGLCTMSLTLTACGNAKVYGGVSVGSSWGGYSSGPNTRVNLSVSGRIR